METRTRHLQNRSILDYLIKWKKLPPKIPHRRMRILYISIQNYSSVEDNHFLKERGVLGPYNTGVAPLLLLLVYPPIVIVVRMYPPYCYFYAPQKPTIFIVVPLHYYCYVGSNYIVTPQTPIYRKQVLSFVSSKNFSFRFCHL